MDLVSYPARAEGLVNKKHGVFYTSDIPEVTWYEPLYNILLGYNTHTHTKIKDPSLPYYLPITGERIVEFITFPRVLTLRDLISRCCVHLLG